MWTREIESFGSVDFRGTLNPNLIPDQHPMPTLEELTAKIARGQEYTVIDLKDTYLKMEVMEQFHTLVPRMDQDIYDWVKECQACQKNRGQEPEVPLYSWNIPEWPWKHVHVDFAGLFQKKQWFILVDTYSKWTEVVQLKDMTSQQLIITLRRLFARYGVPRQLVSDNGTSFTSEKI
ncbi:hypothetical protein J437_LFUL013809 [Ladona fulva]|uniref:Integrase catalytic domain-containing protein n=1 Tax=Ladona fulva TaxID=123851 RepID=A0A8K0KFT8_LADFU|nr:hypothetical protein J437_LFUL013809 [Ladona fulva]